MYSTLLKKSIPFILFALISTSCSGWGVQPLPYNPPTPIMVPSRTPSIQSPTPVSIGSTSTPATATATFLPTSTDMSPATETPAGASTPTNETDNPMLHIVILGCDTSIDITHGMGEVTNAYITLKNEGNVELTNLIATLYALDEGRQHPDKTLEVASIPVGYQVTLKLTVDSTYKQESPIQVEVNSAQGLFPREGSASCRDIGILAPQPNGLNTPVPINP